MTLINLFLKCFLMTVLVKKMPVVSRIFWLRVISNQAIVFQMCQNTKKSYKCNFCCHHFHNTELINTIHNLRCGASGTLVKRTIVRVWKVCFKRFHFLEFFMQGQKCQWLKKYPYSLMAEIFLPNTSDSAHDWHSLEARIEYLLQ